MDKQFKILLVEDDINISSLLCDLLKEHNFYVHQIFDGNKVLGHLQEEAYDIILMDEVLPNIYGSELIIRIRSDNNLCQVPIIMMTSLKDDDHQTSVLKEGADDYLHKPVKFNILLARMENILKRSHSRKFTTIEVPADSNPQSLTPKEKEVLALLVKGYSNSKIASELFISENTVSNHIKNVQAKLKADNRAHSAVIAIKLGLY